MKVYLQGVPGWIKANHAIHVNGSWVAKNLNANHVIVDIRPLSQSRSSQIKGAVSFSSDELVQMGKAYATKKRGKKVGELYSKRILPNLFDKKAPIIIYGSSDKDTLKAYHELISWKYKKVAILTGGFEQWQRDGFPTTSRAISKNIHYVKKLVKGAISPENFARYLEADRVILDVRTAKEVMRGKLAKSIHIPLSKLGSNSAQLPKNKLIVIHCRSGARAEIAYNILKNQGFKDVKFLNSIIEINSNGGYSLK